MGEERGPVPGRDKVTIQEAARRLGITESAIRKRISRGHIASEREGERVYVYLGTSETQPGQSPGEVPDSVTQRLLAAREDEIVHLREQLTAEREANRENRRIIAGLLERIPELEAPQSHSEATEGGERGMGAEEAAWASQEPTEATPEPAPRRPWWKRVWEKLR